MHCLCHKMMAGSAGCEELCSLIGLWCCLGFTVAQLNDMSSTRCYFAIALIMHVIYTSTDCKSLKVNFLAIEMMFPYDSQIRDPY